MHFYNNNERSKLLKAAKILTTITMSVCPDVRPSQIQENWDLLC